ncbi:hypothetical protein GCM10027168_37310 [Streptomyces capparidis]
MCYPVLSARWNELRATADWAAHDERERMPPVSNPTGRQQRSGAELRKLREGAGLSTVSAPSTSGALPSGMSARTKPWWMRWSLCAATTRAGGRRNTVTFVDIAELE